jgi:tryptophan-rich sensory protein
MKYLHVLVSIAIAQLAGIIGSVFTFSSVGTWYVDLIKPSWNPPSCIFGPVWITLYAFMGAAAYLVFRERKKKDVKSALTFYGIQLGLNALWSILFFGLKNPGIAFIEILVLLAFISLTIVSFWRISRWAGVLLLPYLAWVAFATYLNYTIWQLNI